MFPKCFILEAEKELAASCFVLHSKQNKASFLKLLTAFVRLNRGSYIIPSFAFSPLSSNLKRDSSSATYIVKSDWLSIVTMTVYVFPVYVLCDMWYNKMTFNWTELIMVFRDQSCQIDLDFNLLSFPNYRVFLPTKHFYFLFRPLLIFNQLETTTEMLFLSFFLSHTLSLFVPFPHLIRPSLFLCFLFSFCFSELNNWDLRTLYARWCFTKTLILILL